MKFFIQIYIPHPHLETHLKKCYNQDMNTIGMLSSSSAYAINATSVYGLSKQNSSAEQTALSTTPKDEIKDEAFISDAAKALLEKDAAKSTEQTKQTEQPFQAKKELTPEQKQEVATLKFRDSEVKTHEQAHIAAAAGISVSSPSYEYQTGPDGKQYAIGGEVNVSFSQGSSPEENIAKAQTMRAAALAPAEPSGQDLSVASKATQIIEDEKKRLAEQKSEKDQEEIPKDAPKELNKKTDLRDGDKKTEEETEAQSTEKTESIEV